MWFFGYFLFKKSKMASFGHFGVGDRKPVGIKFYVRWYLAVPLTVQSGIFFFQIKGYFVLKRGDEGVMNRLSMEKGGVRDC